MARIKAIFRENATDADIARVMQREGEALAALRTEPDHREAVQAFLEKRAPRFNRVR